MNVFWVFVILFTLTMGLIFGMDFFQGASFSYILENLNLSKTELVGEDYVLIFLFTVPFAAAKILIKHLKEKKKKQNQGQNTAN